MTIEFRAVGLADPAGNSLNNQIAFELQKELLASPLTHDAGTNAPTTMLEGTVSPVEEVTGTFRFRMLWRLKTPIKH